MNRYQYAFAINDSINDSTGNTTRFCACFCDRGKYTKKKGDLASDLGYVVGLLFYTSKQGQIAVKCEASKRIDLIAL